MEGNSVMPGAVFDTKEDVSGVISNSLVKRFTGAFKAPCYHGRLFDGLNFTCYHGRLFDDLNSIRDTEAAAQLLEATYVFPEAV